MTIIKADPAEGNPKYTLPDIVAYDSASGITKNTGNTRVPIPLEELVLAKCRSVTIDISLLTLTVFLTAGQLALYNFYFVSFKDERLDRMVQHANATEHCHLFCNESDRLVAPKYMEPYKRSFELKFVWYFLAPDIIAVASMVSSFIFLTN